jgi:hypothetical protein
VVVVAVIFCGGSDFWLWVCGYGFFVMGLCWVCGDCNFWLWVCPWLCETMKFFVHRSRGSRM